MSNTSLSVFVTGFKQRNPYKDTLFAWQMLILIIFWMELSVVKMSLKGMWVLIVMSNITDGNNHNSVLYVVVHYIIINIYS